MRVVVKQKIYSLFLNVSIEMSVDHKSYGRLFHTVGPQREKLSFSHCNLFSSVGRRAGACWQIVGVH